MAYVEVVTLVTTISFVFSSNSLRRFAQNKSFVVSNFVKTINNLGGYLHCNINIPKYNFKVVVSGCCKKFTDLATIPAIL